MLYFSWIPVIWMFIGGAKAGGTLSQVVFTLLLICIRATIMLVFVDTAGSVRLYWWAE